MKENGPERSLGHSEGTEESTKEKGSAVGDKVGNPKRIRFDKKGFVSTKSGWYLHVEDGLMFTLGGVP